MKFSRVYVEITNACNLSCSFCHGTKRAKRLTSKEEFAVILRELSGLTDYIYLHVMGEPLSHPYIGELIKMANERGFKVAITTNGTLLPTRAAILLDSKPYKVNISLHSFEKDDSVNMEKYLDACFDFADKASDGGILTVLRLWNRGYDGGRNLDVLSLLRRRFPNDEWAEGARGFRLRHRLHLEWGERFEWPDLSGEDLGEDVFCHGMGDHFGILSDGTVIPCCLDAEGVVRLGNIFEDPISDILASERAVAIREGFRCKRAVEELCRRCPYARRFKI
ncbi:MAG: radical SAM protein [Clostridia bacterium]|nr:radical SAM protein [Clostridia bacterium]